MTNIHDRTDSRRINNLRAAIEHLLQAQLALDEAMLGENDATRAAVLKGAVKQLRAIEGKLTVAAR
jgi:hypothetical protein